jgi:hypothetical protein
MGRVRRTSITDFGPAVQFLKESLFLPDKRFQRRFRRVARLVSGSVRSTRNQSQTVAEEPIAEFFEKWH